MRIALYNKNLTEAHLPFVQELLKLLKQNQAKVSMNKYMLKTLRKLLGSELQFPEYENHFELVSLNPDFVLTLGGDGTILECVGIVRDSKIPIAGINLGRLGFLANVEKAQIELAIHGLFSGAYQIDQRTLLHLDSNKPIFTDFHFALNDCTLLKRDTSSMVVIHTYINGEFLNSYWADGLIVSTPTGSTGYSLSCGGPIIFPNSGNFVITPVAPHNLNVRPIVISDDSVISFEVEGRSRSFLCTLDSRYEMIDNTYQIAIRKADFTINLVRFKDKNFLTTMRDKLNWGIDVRN